MSGAPATRGRKWALTGLPLATAGIGCFYAASLYPAGFQLLLFLFLGLGLLIGSGLAASSHRRCRNLAMIAWIPLFFAVPFGTILIFFAIRALGRDPVEAPASRFPLPSQLASLPSTEEISRHVGAEAERLLRIPLDEDRDQWDRETIRDLRVTPGNFAAFLDDLEEDYGLVAGAADRRDVKTLTDMVAMLGRALAG